MSAAVVEVKKASDATPVKKQKTGGRVKKSLEDLMARSRIANEIAGFNDDTNVPEELAAIYLCIPLSDIVKLRKTKKLKPVESSKTGAAGKPKGQRLGMLKVIPEGAVGQNQTISYKMGELRRFRDENTVESSFEAAVLGGLYGFMTHQVPFFAKPEVRADRGRVTLVANAWDPKVPSRDELIKAVLEGKLRTVWLTPAQAATSRWTKLVNHKKFSKPWLSTLKGEINEVRAAIEATEIAAVLSEKSTKKSRKTL
jgi:hypothetical protein